MKNNSLKLYRLAVAAAVIGTGFGASSVHAQDATNDVQTLIQRINELEQKVKILERNREVDQEIAHEKPNVSPTVSLGANGLSVRSADSNFVMNIRGYIQADARFYLGQKSVPDTFLLRRMRPIIEGTVFDKFDYRVMLDIASGNVTGSSAGNNALIDDAYLNARFLPQFQVQIGKYKSPVGLERLQSTADLLFVETGFATQLTPNYDFGAMIHNDYFNKPFGYAVGIFNGAADSASIDQDVNDEGKDVEGRLFAQPFLKTDFEPLRQLGFGAGGSVGTHAGPLPSYKTPGLQTFFSYATNVTASGQQYRVDPQAYYYWGSFGLEGEYILSRQTVRSAASGTTPLNNIAWQVEASYLLTGEPNSFKATSAKRVIPLHPFGAGGLGAFEIVGRVQQLTMDRLALARYGTATSARAETAWGVGLNWYLNANVKLNLDYEQTYFRNGSTSAGSVTARDEKTILSRVQVVF
jgi:phosphate-selective porin OprO and OprP